MSEEQRVVKETLWKVSVTCTDQGQHKKLYLSTAEQLLWSDGSTSHYMSHYLRHFSAPDETAEPGGVVSRTSYTFICPTCRRNPSIERGKWWKSVDAVHAAGLGEVDLSMLGF